MVKSVKLLPGYAINHTWDASLWSHCSFLRDTVAATVQLAWPGTWLAAGSFSQMPVAFQLGTKRNSFKHTMARKNRKKCLCGALQWWITLDYFAPSALRWLLIKHFHNKDEPGLFNLFSVKYKWSGEVQILRERFSTLTRGFFQTQDKINVIVPPFLWWGYQLQNYKLYFNYVQLYFSSFVGLMHAASIRLLYVIINWVIPPNTAAFHRKQTNCSQASLCTAVNITHQMSCRASTDR